MPNPKKTRRELDPAEANLIDDLRAGDLPSALESFTDIACDIEEEAAEDDEELDMDDVEEED